MKNPKIINYKKMKKNNFLKYNQAQYKLRWIKATKKLKIKKQHQEVKFLQLKNMLKGQIRFQSKLNFKS